MIFASGIGVCGEDLHKMCKKKRLYDAVKEIFMVTWITPLRIEERLFNITIRIGE